MQPQEPDRLGLDPVDSSHANLVGERGTRLDIRSLRGQIHEFLNRGVDGALLSLKGIDSRHEFIFRKYIHDTSNYGLEIIIKNPDRDVDLTKTIGEFCAGKGINFQISEDETVIGRKISIECGKDVETAYSVFVHIVRNVICLPMGSKFDLDSSGLSPWKEIIDSPAQIPASREEGGRLNLEWIRRTSGTGPIGLLTYAFLRMLQLVGTLGIVLTLVFAWDTWQIGSHSASGPTAQTPFWGAISVAVAAVGFLVIFTPTFWRVPSGDRVKGMLTVPKTPYRILLQIFRQPLNMITIGALAFAVYAWF